MVGYAFGFNPPELHYPGGFADDDQATNYFSREAAAVFSGRGEPSPKIDSNRLERRPSKPKGAKVK
jgi:hypothetical protein